MDECVFTDNFNLAHDAIREGVKHGLKAIGFAIQEQAIENVTILNAVDTGAMRLSIYVEADALDQRMAKLSAALAIAKPGASEAIQGRQIDTDVQVRVGVCVNYGIYVEMGTVHMPARPYLAPAANTVNIKAQDLMAKFVSAEIRKSV